MTLKQLQAKLQVTTGTNIQAVLFDWQEYLNENYSKVYPAVLWSLNGAEFETDIRPGIITKKVLTLKVFAINSFDNVADDQLQSWDTLETSFNAYLNAVNAMAGLQIKNVNQLKGQYFPEGLLSVDSELGIGFQVVLEMVC